MTLSFRLLTEADLAVADRILVAAYQFNKSREGLIRQYLTFQPDGWWLALIDGESVGYGGAVNYGVFSSIGMLSVSPAMQRQGIGRALMEHIMQWCVAHGCQTMFLEANEKSASLYQRLGFIREDLTFDFAQEGQTRPPRNLSSDETLSLLHTEEIPALVAFDRSYFGADRSRVLIADATIAADRVFVTHSSSGNIAGYLIAKSSYLGPWVASTRGSAERILQHVLSLLPEGGYSVSIPQMNREGIHLLEHYGFQQKRSMVHMRCGAPVPRRREKIFGLMSPALG